MMHGNFAKLEQALGASPGRPLSKEIGVLVCIDEWTVRELLAVRAWWVSSVADWVEAGGRGVELELPAVGYTWRETPALNAAVVEELRSADAAKATVDAVWGRLHGAHMRVLEVVEGLSDADLLLAGRFGWARRYPVARWVSMNTSRQCVSAASLVRRARSHRD